MPSGKSTEDLGPEELRQHIEDMRRELVVDKMRIIELQDEIRLRQTDHADAIALLGQAELLLEGKIEYILNLDHTLNARIKELEAECDRKSEEIDRRGEVIAETEARDAKNRSERDAIIKNLSERLEAANQEVGKAHELARGIDQERAAKIVALESCETQRQAIQEALAKAESDLATARSEIECQVQEIESIEQSRTRVEKTLEEAQREVKSLQSGLQTAQEHRESVEASMLWRISRPWRALFGPK